MTTATATPTATAPATTPTRTLPATPRRSRSARPRGSARRRRVPKHVWESVSRAMTDEVPVIAGREDLLVRVALGAGRGAPACFLPTKARIEINGHLFTPVDPATITPNQSADRARYPGVWGALVHECAHAQHSRWKPRRRTPPAVVAAAMMLEESRIEAAHLRRRPDDRYYLRATVRTIVAPSMSAPFTAPPTTPDTEPSPPVGHTATASGTAGSGTAGLGAAPASADTPSTGGGAVSSAPGALSGADAAEAAGLLLARVDAGVLTADEVAPLAAAVAAALGTGTLERLRRVWREAHTLDDHDAAGMTRLGREWCDIAGIDPAQASSGSCRTPMTPMSSGALPGPVAAVLDAIAANVATEAPPRDAETETRSRRNNRQAENQARNSAQRTANDVFNQRNHRERSATAGTRSPTTNERAAARRIARAFDTAGLRERVKIKTSSALPPGRLRMRGALAADAQRAAGAIPTAQPFQRVTRRTAPAPPLRVGIACDVSGSMEQFVGPVASTAWILAHAAHRSRVHATTATLIYGNHVRPITQPGTPPGAVTEFRAKDTKHALDRSIEALDGALDLTVKNAARLLVIVSDGRYQRAETGRAQRHLDRLTGAGCGVLWLAPAEGDVRPLAGATVHRLGDPATTADAIARAAATALRR